jgi:hypothetical protein
MQQSLCESLLVSSSRIVAAALGVARQIADERLIADQKLIAGGRVWNMIEHAPNQIGKDLAGREFQSGGNGCGLGGGNENREWHLSGGNGNGNGPSEKENDGTGNGNFWEASRVENQRGQIMERVGTSKGSNTSKHFIKSNQVKVL